MRYLSPRFYGTRFSALCGAAVLSLLLSPLAQADTVSGAHSTIQINFNSGFSDATAISAVGGNSGTTVGQQRKNAYIAAAQIIADQVYSPVTIVIDATFANIGCDAFSATLGSAGAYTYPAYGSPAPSGFIADTFYPVGLFNAISGSDYSGAISDITSQFNSDIGTSGCLEGSNGWYYGFDTPPSNYIGFFTVLLHEMTHGLGFASLVDPSSGEKANHPSGLDDIFSNFLYSQADGAWPGLTDGQRANSAISSTGLLWNGSHTNTAAAALSGGAALTAGFHDADSSGTFTSGDRMQMYAPGSIESGSSVSHFNTTASPNELMEPQYTDYLDSLGLALYVLKDIGWTVYPPAASNNAPVFTAIGAQSTHEDTAKTITLAATDADSDSLTFSVSASCATSITCAISGTTLTATPAANYHGSGSITVTVSDGNGGSDTDTFTLTVNSVNDAPVFGTISAQSTNEDTAKVVSLAGTATDVDGDGLTYSVSSCPSNISCSLSGTSLTLTPDANFNGSRTVGVGVSDGNGGSASTTFNLTVNAVNDAPVFGSISAQSTNEDTAKVVSLAGTATDADGNSLTYSVSSCPSNISCSLSGTSLTLTPDANFNGSRTVGVGVSDGNGGSASTTFSLTVTAVNDAPTLGNPGTQSMDVSDSLSLTLAGYGSDVDGDSLTYIATCSPSPHLLCPISGGALNLSTDASFTSGTVSLTVTDTSSATASVSFTVNLTGSYSLTLSHNGSPVSSGSSIELAGYSFTLSNNSGQYSISAELDGQNVSDLISVSGSTFTLAMPASGQFAGTYTLSIFDADASLTTTFDLLRPVRLSLNHAALLSGESLYQLDIEGGSAATVFNLSSSDSIVGFEDALGNIITSASAANNAVTFNRATAWLAVNTASQSTVDLSADSAAYGTTSLDNVAVYPALSYSLHLEDATGSALAGSLVLHSSSLLTDLGVELSAESSNGEFSLNLPAGVSISGTASAQGYTDAEFTLDGSNNDVTVTLTESTLPITISGTITGNGGLDFEQEAPLVKITLQGGQQLSVTVDVQSATQASFSKQLDLNSQTPASLSISHSQSATATLGLSSVSTDKHFEINMVKVNSSTSVTVVTTVTAGTKKGGAVLSYLLLCTLPLMWRRRKNRQY